MHSMHNYATLLYLKICDLPWVWSMWKVFNFRNVQIFLVDFCFNVTKFTFQLIAASNFTYKLALKGIHICIQL